MCMFICAVSVQDVSSVRNAVVTTDVICFSPSLPQRDCVDTSLQLTFMAFTGTGQETGDINVVV